MKRKEVKQKALPTGWREVRLGEVGSIHSGGTPATRDDSNWDGDIPWLTPSEVTKLSRKDISATERKITPKGLSSTTLLPPNCLIVCTRATIGHCCINVVPMAINQGFKCIQPHKDYSVTFLYYVFQLLKQRLVRLSCGNTFGEVSKKDFQNILITLPPLPEQKAIASLLETWDTAIEKTEALITAKEKQSKWVLRKLITENLSKWKYIKVNTLFKVISIKGFSSEELLSVTQDRGVIPRNMLEGRVMSPKSGTQGYKLVVPGNFVISLRSFQGGLEYSKFRGIVSPAYTVLSPKKEMVDLFYKYFFKSHIFIEKYLSLSVIGIRDGKQISLPDFETVKLPYPRLDEQRRIANMLRTANKEIELFKRLAKQYRIQKCSLMKKLLTGKWKVNEHGAIRQ